MLVEKARSSVRAAAPLASAPADGALCEAAVYVHPSAICETSAIGDGTRVWAFAHIMDGAVVGGHCNIADHVFIEGGARIGDRVTIKNGVMIFKGVTIEDDAFIGPGVLFTNDRYPRSPRMAEVAEHYRREESWLCTTTVCRGATLGAGVVVLPGVIVGAYAVVGAGAVVTRNIAERRLVTGNPARESGWACTCGKTLPDSLRCMRCSSRYRLHDQTLRPIG